MTRHDSRDAMTGRFTPKPVLPEFEDEREFNDPRGVHVVGESRYTGRVDTDAAYLPGEYRNPLAKYQQGPNDQRIAQTLGERYMPYRRPVEVNADISQRLDERVGRVEQPEQVMAESESRRPADYRLMSRKTFGHLDRDED
jgi:hypothetical protein